MAVDRASDANAHCQALVREYDRDRYYATLFAPADKRPHLFALYAFSTEIGRVREAVSAPLPGEIRLQWWRDALEGAGRGNVVDNPVAAVLEAAVEASSLPREPLLAMIEARTFDLYDDPMPSIADLEGYLGETSSALIRLASLVLADGLDPGGAEAAGHAGIAYGIAGLLRALPWHSRKGQLYLPRDLLERHGVTRDDVVLGRGGPGLTAALADLRALARRHVAEAKALSAGAEAAVRTALLPISLVGGYLDRMERPGYDPFRTVVERPDWLKIAALWRASRRGLL